MSETRLYRSVHGRVIGGVAGGLADFFGIDPTIIRLIFVLLVIFGGSGVLIYIILWIILPEKNQYNTFYGYTPPPQRPGVRIRALVKPMRDLKKEDQDRPGIRIKKQAIPCSAEKWMEA